jgi:hypothetical protein
VTRERGEHRTTDLEDVVGEVEAEARRVRESGELGDLERELDLLFEELVPGRVDERDFEAVLDRAERAALIDILAPIDEERLGYAQAKRAVRKMLLWYMDYIVQQLSTFAGATTRAVRILGERVEHLEERLGTEARSATHAGSRPAPPGASPAAEWAEWAVARLEGVTGRVLHADAGDGTLLRALVDAGLDAYGVEPQDRARAPADSGLEVKAEGVLEHLGRVGEGALHGLVLSGCVDRLPVEGRLSLADRVAEVMAPAGVVVVVGLTPAAWLSGRGGVEADLTVWRPFQPDTWTWLLGARGFEAPEVAYGPAPPGLPLPDGPDDASADAAAAIRQAVEWVNAVLLAPDSYALAVRRAG